MIEVELAAPRRLLCGVRRRQPHERASWNSAHVCKTYRRGGLFSRGSVEAVKQVSFRIDAERP